MEFNQLKDIITKLKVIPVIKLHHSEDAQPLAKALMDGGLPAAEITFRSDAAVESIKKIKTLFPKMLVAAGTIIDKAQVDQAIEAGADFIVSPGLDIQLVQYCQSKNIIILPGIVTASEAQSAIKLGLEIVKFFPAEASGGLKAISGLAAPFAQLNFMPTGGIDESNILTYLNHPKVLCCGGSWMVNEKLMNTKNFSEITKIVKNLMCTLNDINKGAV